ncbi:B12-binding domain-containing radical SAM protein [Burkholderia glumae]|uniref:B12-binding domain-containing radical SAM protein n=1 Tax=Burkholderia glumae TaxID=337 RepID=UPI002150BE9E|nr:radical SAM protein [Burkholderia glumae]
MNRSNIVAFVSAGMLSPKKRDHALARRQLYLNYGALSLATILDAMGTATVLVHGEHNDPADVLGMLLDKGVFPSRLPVMVSIPSFYALPWAQVFCRLVRGVDPEARIIVGGRWVVGPDPDWLHAKLPEANVLVPGLAEPVIASLLTSAPIIRRLPAPTPDFVLNHPLTLGFERYQPSIETSRGCGMGCAFCEERDIRLEKLRAPEQITEALAAVVGQYGDSAIRPYFQSSLFAPNENWGAGLANAIRAAGLNVSWRTESRVDAITPDTISCLAEAGMKVLDLGLETASPTQIVSMRKSRDPDRYLERASSLLKACGRHGIAAKVNVLLYAGETTRTFDETRSFLDEHRGSIAGVSVGPVVAYGPPKVADILLREWSASGAVPVDPRSADESGISMIHLSHDFDATSAEAACLELSRRYMDAEAYFNLKSFSYYPRDYARADFDRDVAASDRSKLPFRVPPAVPVRPGEKADERGALAAYPVSGVSLQSAQSSQPTKNSD